MSLKDMIISCFESPEDAAAWLAEAGIVVMNLQIRKEDVPKAREVLAGRFKENLSKTMVLELLDPKHKGTTEIELSVYTSTNPRDMIKDPDTANKIKKGLGAIYSKSVSSRDKIGLLVKKAIDALQFRVHDPAMAGLVNQHMSSRELSEAAEKLWTRYATAWRKGRRSPTAEKLWAKINTWSDTNERNEMFRRFEKMEEYGYGL